MTIESGFFRQVLGQFATGVSVVTTGSNGSIAGITVNAFCSVSLHPPLVLVCIELTSQTLPLIRESGAFAVNILTAEQEYLARCFARKSEERHKHFCHAGYHYAATGSPILNDTLAFVDARIVAEYPGGDHVIFLGEVVALGADGIIECTGEEERQHTDAEPDLSSIASIGKTPLAFYRGQYSSVDNETAEAKLVYESGKVRE